MLKGIHKNIFTLCHMCDEKHVGWCDPEKLERDEPACHTWDSNLGSCRQHPLPSIEYQEHSHSDYIKDNQL